MRATILVAMLALAAPSAAEVTRADAAGFAIRHRVAVAAAPERLWVVLLRPADWWDPAHSYSGEAGRLRLEARADGCFCETLKDGGSVEHLRVVQVRPPATLRLTGGLGPLQGEPVTGVMTFTIAPAAAGGIAADARIQSRRPRGETRRPGRPRAGRTGRPPETRGGDGVRAGQAATASFTPSALSRPSRLSRSLYAPVRVRERRLRQHLIAIRERSGEIGGNRRIAVEVFGRIPGMGSGHAGSISHESNLHHLHLNVIPAEAGIAKLPRGFSPENMAAPACAGATIQADEPVASRGKAPA